MHISSKLKYWTFVFPLAFLFIVPLSSWAAEKNAKGIFDLSLEELMEVRVISASKKTENIKDAPGIITVITAKEIEEFGANSLMDILDRVPGFLGMWHLMSPQSSFAVRGDLPSSTTPNHILLLINSRPARDSIVGSGNHILIYTAFPVQAIKRIEIIRGPGSILYGTNAYSGVVNIITKKSLDYSAEISAGGGSFGTTMTTVSGGFEKDKLSVVANANFFNEDGWNFEAYMAPGTWRSTKQSEDIKSGNIDVTHGAFSMTAFWGENEQGYVSPAPSAVPSDNHSKYLFLDLGYEYQITSVWKTTTNITYNKFETDMRTAPGSLIHPEASDVVLEHTNHIKSSENLNLLFGGSAYIQSGKIKLENGFSAVPSYNQTWWNAYFQADYRPVKHIKLIAGGQFNKPHNVEFDFVPRLGAIIDVDKNSGIKILYGQAFRSSFAIESNMEIPGGAKGYKDLVPEKVETIDTQFYYNTERAQFSATYFHSKQDKLITYVPSTDPNHTIEAINKGEMTLQGIEFETKYSPASNFFFTAAVTWQESEDEDEVKDPMLVPNILVKTGISYIPKSGLSVGVFNSYSSKPDKVSDMNPAVANLNPVPKSVNYLTANIRLNISRYFRLKSEHQYTFNFYGQNLLDEQVDYPGILFKRINSVPGRGGRALYGQLSVKF